MLESRLEGICVETQSYRMAFRWPSDLTLFGVKILAKSHIREDWGAMLKVPMIGMASKLGA